MTYLKKAISIRLAPEMLALLDKMVERDGGFYSKFCNRTTMIEKAVIELAKARGFKV